MNIAIKSAFSKFGDVELVESVKGSSKTKPDIYEAYVTFKRCEDAYKAFKANRRRKKSSEEIVSVLPADTWRLEPLGEEEELAKLSHRIANIENDNTQFIYKMFFTRGMLLRIFRAFLRLSRAFLTGLILQYGSENSSDEESDDDSDSDSDTDSDTDKETDIKADVEADIEADTSSTEAVKSLAMNPEIDASFEHIKNREFERRITELITRYIGPKFCTLTIKKRRLSMKMLQWYRPILKPLTILKLHSHYDCNILFALHEYCPNLVSFHLLGDEWDGDFDRTPVAAWPSLKDFFLNISDMDDDELCDEGNLKLCEFFKLNPQITTIQICSIISDDILSSIGKNLKGLTTLAFVRQNFDGLNFVLDHISKLKQLRGLKITAMEVERMHLSGLIKCTKQLSRLDYLHLITLLVNCEPNTNVGEDFPHHKEFCITHHYDCKCHGPNRTLSFGKVVVEVPGESSVLVLVVNTRHPDKTRDEMLKPTILKTFRQTTRFYPNIIKQYEQVGNDSYMYIQISCS